MQKYIKIHPADKVAVALCPLPAGTLVSIDHKEITLSEDIPRDINLPSVIWPRMNR